MIQTHNVESEEVKYKPRIEQAKVYLDRTVTRGAKLMKKIATDKKQQIDLIESNTLHSLSELKYQNADLTTTIQILVGEYSEEPELSELPLIEVDIAPIEDKPKRVVAKKAQASVARGQKMKPAAPKVNNQLDK